MKLNAEMRKRLEETAEAEHAVGDSRVAEAITMLLEWHDRANDERKPLSELASDAAKAIDRIAAADAAMRLALPVLEEERESWVQCGSNLTANPDGGVDVVPDTLDEEHKPIVARFDAAIAGIKAALANSPGSEAAS